MTTLYLIHPLTHTVSAELIPSKEVIFHDKMLLKSLEINGLTVSREFKEKNKTAWRLTPPDSKASAEVKAIFAKAFEECCFPRGLSHLGYKWSKKKPAE